VGYVHMGKEKEGWMVAFNRKHNSHLDAKKKTKKKKTKSKKKKRRSCSSS
tara:strand:+ start:433 stop:582 length:150 start_codon:yes stop_codon:yes gene_type:complete